MRLSPLPVGTEDCLPLMGWSRLGFCGRRLLTTRFLWRRRRGLVRLRLGSRGMSNLGLWSRSMLNLCWSRFDFLLWRRGLMGLRLGSRGMSSLGLRSSRMTDLGGWRLIYLLGLHGGDGSRSRHRLAVGLGHCSCPRRRDIPLHWLCFLRRRWGHGSLRDWRGWRACLSFAGRCYRAARSHRRMGSILPGRQVHCWTWRRLVLW
jgi:hypothetical protein